MRPLFFGILLSGALVQSASAQTKPQLPSQPKLVVGIVVDQMRYDYLYRYYSKFTPGGFKRLMEEGFNCRNSFYSYVPTYTAPGHSSIFTGTTPATHGIVGNDWYDRALGKEIYCTADESYSTVGSTSKAGQMSPKNLLCSTLGDQLKFANNQRSKVIGIALKDRSSILPAGHSANAAYWFDNETGNWITSSYYMKELPAWTQKFNGMKQADSYLRGAWRPLLPIGDYVESTADNMPYESPLLEGELPQFPYELFRISEAMEKAGKKPYGLLRSTPFGNTLTKDFALATIVGENLGKGVATDMLCVSFSSTDYVGHSFGPNAIETEDTYLRLDRDIAEFIAYLDTWVGRNNYVIFLSADHGVAPVPVYLQSLKSPAGVINEKDMETAGRNFLSAAYGVDFVQAYCNQQFYLNRTAIKEKGLQSADVQAKLAEFLRQKEHVFEVLCAETLQKHDFREPLRNRMQKGFMEKRCGDVLIAYEPGYFEGKKTGTTHGEAYSYDTQVPLLWLGWKIPKGFTTQTTNIVDIAASLAALLNLQQPSGCEGEVIEGLVK